MAGSAPNMPSRMCRGGRACERVTGASPRRLLDSDGGTAVVVARGSIDTIARRWSGRAAHHAGKHITTPGRRHARQRLVIPHYVVGGSARSSPTRRTRNRLAPAPHCAQPTPIDAHWRPAPSHVAAARRRPACGPRPRSDILHRIGEASGRQVRADLAAAATVHTVASGAIWAGSPTKYHVKSRISRRPTDYAGKRRSRSAAG